MRPGVIEILDFAFLPRQERVVNGPAVDSRRCPCLEPADNESGHLKLLGEINCCRFAGASSGQPGAGSDMHSAAEKSAGGDYDSPGTETASFQCFKSVHS